MTTKWKLLACTGLLLTPFTLYAGYGNLDIGAGEMNKGSGGVGAAMPQDSLAAAINPAAIAFVPSSRADIGFTGIIADRGYKANASSLQAPSILSGSHDSSSKFIPVPNVGYLQHLKDSPLTYSISISGSGFSTDYDDPLYAAGDASSYYRQILTNFAASWKANDQLALGGSFILATQTLNIEGVNGFQSLSNDPDNLSNNGTNYSFGGGVKIGVMARPVSKVSIGASYQPEIAMTKMNKYSGLLPDDGDMNIPPTATAGISVQLTPTLKAGFDTQYIWYSAVPAYSNEFKCSGASFAPGADKCLGTANGTGFGWRNITAYKVGAVWNAMPTWIFRAGYVYATQPIQSSQILLAPLAPTTVQSQFTLGVTHTIKHRFQVSAMGLYAPEKTISGYNVFAPDQKISVHLGEYELGIAVGYLFGQSTPHTA